MDCFRIWSWEWFMLCKWPSERVFLKSVGNLTLVRDLTLLKHYLKVFGGMFGWFSWCFTIWPVELFLVWKEGQHHGDFEFQWRYEVFKDSNTSQMFCECVGREVWSIWMVFYDWTNFEAQVWKWWKLQHQFMIFAQFESLKLAEFIPYFILDLLEDGKILFCKLVPVLKMCMAASPFIQPWSFLIGKEGWRLMMIFCKFTVIFLWWQGFGPMRLRGPENSEMAGWSRVAERFSQVGFLSLASCWLLHGEVLTYQPWISFLHAEEIYFQPFILLWISCWQLMLWALHLILVFQTLPLPFPSSNSDPHSFLLFRFSFFSVPSILNFFFICWFSLLPSAFSFLFSSIWFWFSLCSLPSNSSFCFYHMDPLLLFSFLPGRFSILFSTLHHLYHFSFFFTCPH